MMVLQCQTMSLCKGVDNYSTWSCHFEGVKHWVFKKNEKRESNCYIILY